MQGRSALTCLVSSSQHICYAKVFPGIMKDNDLKITTCDGWSIVICVAVMYRLASVHLVKLTLVRPLDTTYTSVLDTEFI
ncbi:hypothetical protein BDV35DRAFT_192358 [Aspergillus flavus]|uniref:Uncharacterized protein n=1 Tax=Aspergillus flavus TaxID=5059 RepID=A0A5N6GYS6_ASPFL|nr:hypothetical protein BDV35DRAFT_192358 [Aspergillus flavus]